MGEEGPRELPAPTMWSVLRALELAEQEALHPGYIDSLIARLGSEALRASVITLRGSNAAPAVLEAQADALVWLTALAPLLRAEAARAKRKHKG